ncbi:MAG TPA: DNA translocase FtsK 4TM domain-containing protein [Candidatus Saccharimonadales bacterium]|jgi:S-DNA-T family DNA segregation ATPase FtsK/SpoIIIE
MAKKKKKTAKKVASGPKHTLPDGFWPQVGAVVLAVLAILLILGAAGSGGPFPQATFDLGLRSFGLAVYILPVLLLFRTVQIFKAPDNKVPGVVTAATILFAIISAGFVQLMQNEPAALASTHDDGGIAGWVWGQGALMVVEPRVGALVSIIILFILSLFVLSVSPRTVIDWVANLFKREDSPRARANAAIAERAATAPEPRMSKAIGELKLNQGVPTVDIDAAEEARAETKDKSRLSSMRSSITQDKAAEEQAALTSHTDPNWESPSVDLLEKKQSPADAGDVKHNAQTIKDTLGEFGIDVEMEGANIGPKVTQYTLKPPQGVKLTRITQLETNIALNLAAQALRIEAPIPGQRAVGIEVPNRKAADVRLYGILSAKQWSATKEPLAFAIGKDIAGDATVGELNKMPHLLIAGQTGSGKSVMINTLLTSLLYRNSPSNMRLILVDPKQVEMAPYEDIPHLLTPIITEPEKTISALKWAVNEMERRYSLLAEQKLRDIKTFNDKNKGEAMPYIVIVIDELADLMMVAARDVEALIVRLAQKARAVGIHLVLATQRPSVDVITGLIKANVPARIAFTVASGVDSKTILDQVGAEKLLGQGDMLLLTPSMSKPKRIQGAWVTDDEVMKITDHLRLQRPPSYDDEIVAQPVQLNGKGGVVMDMDAGSGDDDMYKDAVKVVVEAGKASTSLLQRRLRIGYGRAARIIEEMEEQGIVGSASGSKPRDVLLTSLDQLPGAADTTDEFGIPR